MASTVHQTSSLLTFSMPEGDEEKGGAGGEERGIGTGRVSGERGSGSEGMGCSGFGCSSKMGMREGEACKVTGGWTVKG